MNLSYLQHSKTILPFLTILLLLALPVTPTISKAESKLAQITVYKNASCRCCSKWVKHLEKNGFDVKAINRNDMPDIKNKLGIKPQLRSCHTAVVDGYYIEGHVPADDIKRLLTEKPEAAGLVVPGMPIGSPGMEGPRNDAYSVLLIDKENTEKVYNSY